MGEFPFQIERYIIKQLACEEDPATIAEDVKSQFLRDLSPDTVDAYDPHADGSALTDDLRDLYHRTRRTFEGTTEEREERSFVEVATTDAFDEDPIQCIEENGTEIALIAAGQGYAALASRCTHKGGSLCDGDLSDGEIECPLHGAAFDIQTGQPTNPPAVEEVETFEVRVDGDAIEVKV